MDERYQREEELFSEALTFPVAARAGFLDRECGENRELRARIEALLLEHEKAVTPLDLPPEQELAEAARGPVSFLGQTEFPGMMIGRYKLLQQIGEGGCGVVFMAEQEEPIRRRVALKVIKLGMDTREVIARFEAERQALAMMNHPNIARVFDAGATETGRPYFVMELVRGVKITEYCDQQKLSTADRLNLFIPVCLAIQHAHQKGIIHRDIKPSNILVTLQDGAPTAKVIDFGIAKATQGRLTDQTFFTAFEQFIGTPAYMSPEQAQMSSQDVDTRSDIYSLGVLLYELLTGRTPFGTNELLKVGLDEMRRQIREVEPPRPSACLRTLEAKTLTLTAQHRSTEWPKLVHLIRGDLDWIVMRCLEKDRVRRYATADELTRDLERHLRHEPVEARPPSALYVFEKLVRRNKLAVASITLVIAALVIGLNVALWLYSREKQLHARAAAAENQQSHLRQQAEVEANKSRQVAQFLKEMLSGVGPGIALGRDTKLLREILDKTTARLSGDLRGQPEVEAELQFVIGGVLRELGELKKAEEMLRASLATRRELFGPESLPVADALYELGSTLSYLAKTAEAEATARECLTIRRKLLGDEHLAVAAAMHGLASELRNRSDYDQSEPLARRALAIRRRLCRADQPDVAESLQLVGLCRIQRGDYREGKSMLREAIDLYRKTLGDDHPATGDALHLLANFQMQYGEHAAAIPLLREALARSQRTLGEKHMSTAHIHFLLGTALSHTGESTEALAIMDRALQVTRTTIGPDHAMLLTMHTILGAALQKQGKVTEGRAAVGEALEILRKRDSAEWGGALNWMAWQLLTEGLVRESEPLFKESLDLARKNAGPESSALADALHGFGWALYHAERNDEAETAFRERLHILRKRDAGDDTAVAATVATIGRILMKRDGDVAAEPLFREALAIVQKLPEGHIDITAGAYADLAGIMLRQGKMPAAEALLMEAYGIVVRNEESGTESGSKTIEGLANLYATWAKVDPTKEGLAAEWRQRWDGLQKAALDERPVLVPTAPDPQ